MKRLYGRMTVQNLDDVEAIAASVAACRNNWPDIQKVPAYEAFCDALDRNGIRGELGFKISHALTDAVIAPRSKVSADA